ncbi:MAG TPA: hypothetical protein VGE30_03755 [Candidatus Saccharimonadales bacterium]
MNRKKIIQRVLLIGLPLFVLAVLFSGSSFVTIESEQGASIMMTDTKDGAFEKIGTTKVTHFFFRKPAVLYVSAELNGEQSITSVKPKRLSIQSVKLNLSTTTTAKKLSDGAVMDANFEGNKGRGIVYGQNTFVSFFTNSPDTDTDPQILGLPYIQKVVWNDFNNFVYLSDGGGVGQFVGGVDKGDSEVGSLITGDVNIDTENTTEQGTPIILDISRTGDKPLVLLSQGNIFTSTDMGSRLRAITSFEPENRETAIFTADDSIFKVTYPELQDAEVEDSGDKPQILLEEYSYSGEKIQNTYLDDDSAVVNIIKHDDTVYILTQAGLYTVEGETVRGSDIYFANPADMVVYQDQVLVLAKDGLWKVADDKSFQLVFRYSKYGNGLMDSMSIDTNNQLIFGTTATDETSSTATFGLSF